MTKTVGILDPYSQPVVPLCRLTKQVYLQGPSHNKKANKRLVTPFSPFHYSLRYTQSGGLEATGKMYHIIAVRAGVNAKFLCCSLPPTVKTQNVNIRTSRSRSGLPPVEIHTVPRAHPTNDSYSKTPSTYTRYLIVGNRMLPNITVASLTPMPCRAMCTGPVY
jgi:hypothetical protein